MSVVWRVLGSALVVACSMSGLVGAAPSARMGFSALPKGLWVRGGEVPVVPGGGSPVGSPAPGGFREASPVVPKQAVVGAAVATTGAAVAAFAVAMQKHAGAAKRRGVERGDGGEGFQVEDDSGAWHAMDVERALRAMGVSSEAGLSSEAARDRLKLFGANELETSERPSVWKMIAEQFEDRLVQILVCVAVFSAVISFWEDDPAAFIEPLVIVMILVLNAAVGVWQSQSAEGAMEALQKMQPSLCTVLRDSIWQTDTPAKDLVPGDIILLRVGDKIPADARLLQVISSTINADEGSLTGESVTVQKSLSPVDPSSPIQGKTNMLFSGSVITAGTAYAMVTATGMSTEMGKIQSGVQAAKADVEKTPLAQKLDEFGAQLSWMIGFVCVAVWLVNIPRFDSPAFGSPLRGALYYAKIAVALGVAAIPEGLPAVITLCLSLGTRRMAQRNVIVRKLPSVETLGCTTVICTDKTGTLTTNQMTATAFVHVELPGEGGPGGAKAVPTLQEHVVEGVGYSVVGSVLGMHQGQSSSRGISEALECAVLCNDAAVFYKDGAYQRTGEPTEAALKVLAEKVAAELEGMGYYTPKPPSTAESDLEYNANRLERAVKQRWQRVATLEFNRDRKSMGVMVRSTMTNQNRLYVKGAPDLLIDRCTKVRLPSGRTVPMTDAMRRAIQRKIDDMARRPLRTMGLAMKEGKDLGFGLGKWSGQKPAPSVLGDATKFAAVESGLTFLGLCGIKDPARSEVAGAIQRCSEAGVRVMMITGDSKPTAVAIAKDVHIFPADAREDSPYAFTGAEFFKGLSEAQQAAKLAEGKNLVFCRTEPADKQRLIKTLQSLGETPAMTGDGVNDAPALQQAAIGVAMGITGTEVSKEAADMILADDNFATIVAAVEEGRCIYNNMQSFICFLISCNFGEIATVFFSTMLGLPEPLTPLQLLWVNLVTDGPPATALGFNPPEPDAMSKPPRSRSEPILSPWLMTRYILTGLYVGAATIGVCLWWFHDHGVEPLQLMRWNTCAANVGAFNPIGADLLALGVTPEDPCSIFAGLAKAKVQTLALSVLVSMEMLKALSAISVSNSLLAVPPWKNPWLIIGVAFPFGLHLAVLHYPVMNTMFGLTDLTVEDWKRVATCAVPVLLVEEILKAVGRIIDGAKLRRASRLATQNESEI